MTLRKIYEDFNSAIEHGSIEITHCEKHFQNNKMEAARIHFASREFFVFVEKIDDVIYLDYAEEHKEHFSVNSKNIDENEAYMLEFIYNYLNR